MRLDPWPGLDCWPRLNCWSRLNGSRLHRLDGWPRLHWLDGWPWLDHGPLGERPRRLDYPRLDHRPLLDRLHWPDLRLGLDGPGRRRGWLHLWGAASLANRLLLRPSER